MEKRGTLGDLITPAPLVRCGDNDYPVLSMTMHEGIVLQSERFKKSLASLDQSSYKVVNRGQLVVGFPIDEGVLYVQNAVDVGIMSPAYNIWNIDTNKVIPRFLELSLHSPGSMHYYKHHLRGTTARRRSLPTEVLLALPVLLPATERQIHIASCLDKLNSLISLRKQQLVKLDELVKARFVEMFGDRQKWSDWPQVTIEDISIDMRTGPFGSALHHDEFVDEGVFVLGIDNAVENKFSYNRMRYITEEKYEQLKRYTVKPGDVIITIMGTVGRSAVIPENMPRAINTKHLACITLDKNCANPYFLSCAFQVHPAIQGQLKKQTKGAIMDGLNLTIIKGLSFALPPINLQNQFVEFLKQTDKSKLTIQQSLDKLEVLKKSLMQEYFG